MIGVVVCLVMVLLGKIKCETVLLEAKDESSYTCDFIEGYNYCESVDGCEHKGVHLNYGDTYCAVHTYVGDDICLRRKEYVLFSGMNSEDDDNKCGVSSLDEGCGLS